MVKYPTSPARSVFRAIADPTRRAILDDLAGGPRTAGAIGEHFAVTAPAITKHLRVLAEADLVTMRREGRNRIYALNPDPLQQIDAWLTRYRLFWAHRLTNLKDHAERLAAEERRASTDTDAAEPRADIKEKP